MSSVGYNLQAPSLPQSFTRKKAKILPLLAVPAAEYDDLSPKGLIDEGIRDLIDEINACDGFVTTSSCAGRVSVFLEGQKKENRNQPMEEKESGRGSETYGEDKTRDENANEGTVEGRHMTIQASAKLAGVGGKGGGGRWLFVSHDPVRIGTIESIASFLGMKRSDSFSVDDRIFAEERLIHFKFEPMILHILTASPGHAQTILSAALQAGFRESGAIGLASASGEAPTPIVAVRSMGLALESIIGRLSALGEGVCIVPENYLESLIMVANERFEENKWRISRFRSLLWSASPSSKPSKLRNEDGVLWEDAAARRERKKMEGLKRSLELRQTQR